MPKEDGSNPPSGNSNNQSSAKNPRADFPEEGIVSNKGASNPDAETEDSEHPAGKVHWINHATFYLSLILAVLTAGTLRVYYLQLQQMGRQTESAEASSYAACISAQIARQTLLEVQSGEADAHSAASATVAHASVTTRSESPLLSFGIGMSGTDPKSWDNLQTALLVSDVGVSSAERVHLKYAAQIFPASNDAINPRDPIIHYDQFMAGVVASTAFQGGVTQTALRFLDRHGKPIGPLDHDHLEDLRMGKSYIVVFGRADYADVFGLNHWQTFCLTAQNIQMDLNSFPGKLPHEACINYNATDRNLIYSIPPPAASTTPPLPLAEIHCVPPPSQ